METLWFIIVAVMLTAYVVLDGFDLGAGIIYLFAARTGDERRMVLRSIGPVWDGNEVWLLAAGGTLYFAFPQLYASSFSALAADFRALSADHLEFASEAGVAAMAKAGTVAVLLPGAFYALRETRMPPIEALRAHGVPIAISTDCNPGTSPATSLPLMMNMACTLWRLTPREALAGATRNAARALGLADRGTLAEGQRADIALWDIDEPAELAYRIGAEACAAVVRGGRVVRGVL